MMHLEKEVAKMIEMSMQIFEAGENGSGLKASNWSKKQKKSKGL